MKKPALPTPQLSSSSRRRFLKGVGLTLSLPVFQQDMDLLAKAGKATKATQVANLATSQTPMRMVCVANPLGFVPETFFPQQAGALDQLSPLLQPLQDHKKDVSVFSNLDHEVSGGHQAVHSFLSGIRDNEASQWENRNQSVDQAAADLSQNFTRYSSIVASVGANSGELECRTSWTKSGVNIPPITELEKLFKTLFLSDSQAEIKHKKKSYRNHGSILDVVLEQAKTMEKGLAKIDQEKLDEYFTSVRSVEKRLQTSKGWLDKPKPKVDLDITGVDYAFTSRLPLFYDLIRLALQTDSTRVAALSIPGNLPVQDLGLQGNYHAFSHHGKADRFLKPLFKIEEYQMKQLARFIQSLKDTPQPNGHNLLDHTMVLSGSGMGNASSHSNRNLPILLAGGGFKHGSHHALAKQGPKKRPLGNLYTTMLERFSQNEVGHFNKATGNLNDILS